MKYCSLTFSIFFLYFLPQKICAFKKCAHKMLESEEKVPENEIINLHNRYRMMAVNGSIEGQPRASSDSVNLLKWDRELEQLALEVSKTCEFKHVEIITDEYPNGLGQNLYRSCSNKRRKINWNKAIGDWYNEHKKYTFPDKPTVLTGHYTQVVWGKSKLVGCAYTEYFQEHKPKTPYCTLYVCHYDPRGNAKGEAPYKPVG